MNFGNEKLAGWPGPEDWESEQDSGFLGHVGPLWRHRGPSFVYGVLADDRHRGPDGFVASGMVMTLADRGMGAAAREDDRKVRQATAQLNVNFIAPARVGAPLEVECEVVSRTNLLVFMQGAVRQRTQLVATASGVWKVFAPRPPRSPMAHAAPEATAPVTAPATVLPETGGWREQPASRFHAHVGPMLRHEKHPHRFGFMADERHRNLRGVVQGGMVATLAEFAMGAAAGSGESDIAPAPAPAPVQLNISFVAAADPGSIVEADCVVTRRTRSLVFVEAALRQGATVVATASGIWRPL